MAEKYFGGKLPEDQKSSNLDNEISMFAMETVKKYENKMNFYKFSSALSDVWLIISKCNKYIDEVMPWKLGKQPEKYNRLAAVLYTLCELLRVISILIAPFMPDTSKKIQESIGATEEQCTWESAGKWGVLSKNVSVKKCSPLFPRIDVNKEIEELNKLMEVQKQEAALKNAAEDKRTQEEPENKLIGIEDFAKVNLIVAKIKECEPVKKSKKLLKLVINDGTNDRVVVSGISQYYSPEELINRNIILVSNLKPAKLCGVESNGMVLAAESPEGKVNVIFVDDLIPGSNIR